MDSEEKVVYKAGLHITHVGRTRSIENSLELESENKLCDGCKIGKETAIKYCNNCEINLCRVCWSWHDQFKANKDHKVDTIESKNQWMCDKHQENIIDRYCIECNEVCCLKCSEERHDGHDVKTSEAIISNINDLKNYLKYLNKIRLDVTENTKNACEQIAENSRNLIRKIQENSSKMKAKVESYKNRNINEIIEYETEVNMAINQFLKIKNIFIKKRTELFENKMSEAENSMNVYSKESNEIEKNVCANNGGYAKDDANNNNELSHYEEVNYKFIERIFGNLNTEFSTIMRLKDINLNLGQSYNTVLNTRLARRISVPACRLMTVDQPSDRLFVISHDICTFSLDDFERAEYSKIPLYGDISDCVVFQNCILFSRTNESCINAYSLDLIGDKQLYTKHSIMKMNFMTKNLIICINGLQSFASIYRVIYNKSENRTNLFSASLLCNVTSDTAGEILLDCVLFDERHILGCFYSEDEKSSRLKIIKMQCEESYLIIQQYLTYTVSNIALKHNSRNAVMVRDKSYKLTIVSEGNKLIFFSDNFESASHKIELLKVGSINLEEYNIGEPEKIVCNEKAAKLFVMSKSSPDILVFSYDFCISFR